MFLLFWISPFKYGDPFCSSDIYIENFCFSKVLLVFLFKYWYQLLLCNFHLSQTKTILSNEMSVSVHFCPSKYVV